MRIRWLVLMVLLAVSIYSVSVNGRTAMAIEKAKYKVIERDGKYELRQYFPHIVAETIVEGTFDGVVNEGFRRLFRYISGGNRKKESISMTAPVSQKVQYEKISMTAPVGQQKEGNKWRITFLMPSEYTMETLPEPIDGRVRLKEELGQMFAALRYSGNWSKKRFEKKQAQLRILIEKRGFNTVGETTFARYNPPFLPWFLRRNEVLIPVEKSQE